MFLPIQTVERSVDFDEIVEGFNYVKMIVSNSTIKHARSVGLVYTGMVVDADDGIYLLYLSVDEEGNVKLNVERDPLLIDRNVLRCYDGSGYHVRCAGYLLTSLPLGTLSQYTDDFVLVLKDNEAYFNGKILTAKNVKRVRVFFYVTPTTSEQIIQDARYSFYMVAQKGYEFPIELFMIMAVMISVVTVIISLTSE